MEATPIVELLSSWTDLSVEVDVEDSGGSVDDPPVVKWPLARVKQRFEEQDGHPPILCPRLRTKTWPSLATTLNIDRLGDVRNRQWFADQDPSFWSRLVLGQKGALSSTWCTPFESLITVEEGLILLIFSTKKLEAENKTKFEQNPPSFKAYSPDLLSLRTGDTVWLPTYTLYAMAFSEHSLLNIAKIVPHLKAQENERTDTCEVCKAIPFDHLPFEEDPGYPHHESLADLFASSSTCAICSLILQAVEDAQNDFKRDTFDEISIGGHVITDYPGLMASNRHTAKKFGVTQITQTAAGKVLNHIILRSPAKHRFIETMGERDGESHKWLPRLHEKWTRPESSAVRPWLYGNWWVLRGIEPPPYQLIGFGVRLSRMPQFQASHVDNVAGSTIYRGSDIRILAEPFGPLWDMIPGRKIGLESNTTSVFRKLKSWIIQCDRHHQCAPEQSKLPTRILDLEDADEQRRIRLVETHGSLRGRYIALSHCWGRSQSLRTTSSNLISHQKGITLPELPKTFRDAVIVSRALNVRYLWIDCLCIIQGDNDDWEREYPKMCDVYSNSWLTIAASTSTGADSGCFPVRTSLTYISPDSRSTGFNEPRNFKVHTLFRKTNCDEATLYFSKEWMPTSFKENPRLYDIGSFGTYVDPVENEPLNTRAWAFQERYLSPRIVHYAKDQAYFQCQAEICAEDGARFQNNYKTECLMAYRDHPSLKRPHAGVLSLVRGFESFQSNTPSRWRLSCGWNSAVELFSRCELTFDSDKLPAISGLAEWVARETNDQYLAGLWKEHILQDLLWRMYPYEEDNPSWTHEAYLAQTGPLKRLSATTSPSSYRAPTWSWAAMDGSVTFEPISEKHVRAELCDVYVIPAGRTVFGRVKYGWLKIKAPLFEVNQCHESPPIPGKVALRFLFQGQVVKGYAVFDLELSAPCLALFVDSSCALLLRESQKEVGKHERVGLARFFADMPRHQTNGSPLIITPDCTWGVIDSSEKRITVTII